MPHKPEPSEVWKAIETYLSIAYGQASPAALPSAIRSRLATLRSLPREDFYDTPIWETDSRQSPSRFSVRLGNRFYPHMKLTIDRRPDHRGYLFRADTHDQHVCPPPGTRDHEAFCKLMKANQELAQAIEAAWEQQGLPTFKTYLKDDLSRRAQQRQPDPSAATATSSAPSPRPESP